MIPADVRFFSMSCRHELNSTKYLDMINFTKVDNSASQFHL